MSILPFPGRASRLRDTRVARVEALLAENETDLIHYAARLVGNDPDRARDVVQDAFLRLCRQADLDGIGREWLFTVTRNLCVDLLRKESRMTPTDEIENLHAGGADAGGGGTQPPPLVDGEDLSRAVEGLPERQREALRLKFERGLSYAEIAQVMETSSGNVGWILHHAIRGLKAQLVPEGGAR